MKTLRIISLAVAVLITTTFMAQSPEASSEENRDVLVDLTAKVHEGNIYFNLSMVNESKPGVYSMVKMYKDGSFESLGMKEIAVNTINKPILYSFTDKSVGDASVTYKLVRISSETEIVKTWNCSEVANSICLEEALFAEN
jgi:basic membrane lipoprotein Med (substrate-binding protein (PBP1-ABC) superfamily)